MVPVLLLLSCQAVELVADGRRYLADSERDAFLQIFPHHENELAQNEAACCESPSGSEESRLARFWLHNGFVNINNEKMCAALMLLLLPSALPFHPLLFVFMLHVEAFLRCIALDTGSNIRHSNLHSFPCCESPLQGSASGVMLQ
jgi:hypothetical protein